MADWTDDYLVGGKSGSEDWTSKYLIEKPKEVKRPGAQALAPPTEEPIGPFKAGLKGMWPDLQTGFAALQSVAGDQQGAEETLSSAEKNRAEIARRYKPKVPSYKNIRTEEGVLPFLSDVGQYAYEGTAQSLPQMGATALGAGAAALALPASPLIAGIGGGTAAALPFFFGQNIKEQLDEGKSINTANVGTALGAGVAQGALDTLVGKVLPGVGKAAAGGVLLRSIKKGVEGAGIEGLTEAAQQAIQVGQANPSKLFEFGPEVQEELANAALLGGLMGGGIGAGSGAINKRKAAAPPSTPVEEEPPLPPPSPYYPNGTGLPGPFEANPGAMFPEGPYQAPKPQLALPAPAMVPPAVVVPEPGSVYGTTAYGGIEPTMHPDFRPSFEKADKPMPFEEPYKPQGTGLPTNEPWAPDTSVMAPEAPKAPPTGQQVYKDVQQKLLAAGRPPMQANAEATLWRARYETLGKQLGVDAYTAYKQSNVQIQGSGQTATPVASKDPTTLNQDPMESEARHYSKLRSVMEMAPMKRGTGQQWLNYLRKQGVKDEEMIWTDVMSGLEKYKNEPLDKDTVQYWFKDAAPSVFEARIHEQEVDKNKLFHYGDFTVGGYGSDPKSNYREVVLGAENMPQGAYESKHWPKVPNPIGHYRTTDRSTPTGDKVLMAEEFQSDWHQAGRKRGYATPDMNAQLRAIEDRQHALNREYNSADEDRQGDIEREVANLSDEYVNLREQFSQGAPNAPFKETWPNLLFRHALMDAINQGKDYVAWPTGEQQAEIQGHLGPHNAQKQEAHRKFMDGRIVDYANKLGKPFGAKVEKLTIVTPEIKTSKVVAGRPEAYWQAETNMAYRELEEFEKRHSDIDWVSDREDAFSEDQGDPSLPGIHLQHDILAERAQSAHDNLLESQGANIQQEQAHEVHAMKITPQMRELVKAGGLPLFQRGKTPQGNITIAPDKAVIRLFKTANPSTFMHESMHLWLEEMVRTAPLNKQVAFDLQALRDWVGNDGGAFTRQQHEQVARGFEQYLRSGKAPNSALAEVFKKFMQWLTKIYKQAKDLKVDVPENIEKVYGRLLAMDESLAEQDRTMAGDANPLPISGNPETYSQPSNLMRWFGNSVLKDKDGQPRRFYHGTSKDKDFGRFNIGRHGAWFTSDPESASQYAMENDSQGHRYENGRFERTNTHSRVIPTFLKAENPYTGDAPPNIRNAQNYKKAQSDWFDQLRRQGYDSWVPDSQNGNLAVMLKDPTQIKSVHNSGAYSDSSPLILNQTPMEDESSNYSVFQKAARRTKAFFDPFSEIPEEGNYRDIRNLMTGGVGMAEQKARDAKELFAKMDTPTKDRVNLYFETPGANPMVVPADVRTKVVNLKTYINGPLKQKLIDANLLPAEVANKNVDSYLPRLYLKFLLDPSFKGGARLGKAYTKKRGDMTAQELTAMGEVKDPGVRAYHALFRTERDLAVMDFLDKIAANGSWALPESLVDWNGKKVTPYWLKAEAQAIRQGRMQAEESPERRAAMKAEAARMDEMADDHIAQMNQTPFDAKDYKPIPDTADYGPLRGMIVRRQIADDIMGTTAFVDPDNTYDKWFGDRNSLLTKGVSHWKALKVPMNLPSQMRNIASNLILLNLSGIPIHKVGPRMFQAAKEMLNDGKYYQIAKKYGIGRGTFSEQELHQISDELDKLEASKQYGFAGWRHIARAYMKVEKKATDIHGKMEEWGKVAKIIDEMEKGVPENEAVRAANEALFDYSEAHPFIKSMRKSPLGMPFITFQYKMMPLVLKTLKERPTAFLPYLAMAYTVPALVAAGNDIDEEDIDKLKKSLGANMRRKNDMYLLPFKDDAGRWQFVDVGYFMPWQMPTDVLRNIGQAAVAGAEGESNEAGKNAVEAFKGLGLFSNPVLNVAAALTTGVDPFTGRPIADKRDPLQKQVGDIMGYAWSLAAPSLLASYGAAGQLVNKETGTGVNRYGEPTNTYGQIGARALGVNTYPVVPEMQRARNIQQMAREIQDVKSRMTYTLKDQSLTPAQRRDVMESFRDEILDRTKALQKYAKESEPSPKLRAASSP